MDLPDAENRLKILKIFLTQENLETGFQFDKLAKETEGYSGSDLKVFVIQILVSVELKVMVSHSYLLVLKSQNLCIAAAYRPVQELLQEETKVIKYLTL